MNLKKKVKVGLKWTTLRSIVLAIVAIIKIAVLTRFLEKSDFGLMALVMFVMGFMNLFNEMGLTSAILHIKKITRKQYASIYWLNNFVSIGMYGILCLVSPVVSSFYNESELNILIPLVGLNLIISGIGKMFRTIEQKHLLFKPIAIIEIMSAVISLLLAIYLAIKGYGVYSLVYSAILQFLLNNILYLILGLRKYGLLLHYKFFETQPFLKIGIYQVGGQMINYFNKDLDILIVGKFFSSDILGGYSLARELVKKPSTFLNPIASQIGAPALSQFNDNPEILKKYYLKLTNLLASIYIPGYLILGVLAYPIVWSLYGEGYLDITIIVQILCINMALRSIGSNVGNLVIASGRTDLEFKWNIIVLFITPLFVTIGAFFNITTVAAMITTSSLILYVPFYHFLLKKMINVSLKEYAQACFKINLKQFIKI